MAAIQVDLQFPPTSALEALRGETVVVKYGGHALAEGNGLQAFAQDVAYLSRAEVHIVVVHGGGPEITAEMERAGIKPQFVHGHRVTDAASLAIVERVLSGKVNGSIVTALEKMGVQAVGLSGRDGSLIKARYRRPKVKGSDGKEVTVDLGYVGDVERVNRQLLSLLQGGGYTPVIAPLGVTSSGQALNINADAVAGAISGALRASSCVFLTDVSGILADPLDPASLQRDVHARDARAQIASGVISGGMIPKVQACLDALEHGASDSRIADGRKPHALLNVLLPAEPAGTTLTA